LAWVNYGHPFEVVGSLPRELAVDPRYELEALVSLLGASLLKASYRRVDPQREND
jgi:hypothetical protein